MQYGDDMDNQVLSSILSRSSDRKFTAQMPDDVLIEKLVKAAQQAPFIAQLYSILLNRKDAHPFGAPLLFTYCLDFYKLELIMKKRGWKPVTNNISAIIAGIQDVAFAAENMVIAAESLGLGSCFLGTAPYKATKIQEEYYLPQRVFPIVELVVGYPIEDHPPRPRYPINFVLFEDRYPEISEEMLTQVMDSIDEGYLSQGYYKKNNSKIEIEVSGKTDEYDFDNYSWTEHNSRRWGQRWPDPKVILEQLNTCGFPINIS